MSEPAITLLLDGLDQAYDHTSWHGPNLKGSIRRVNAEEASRRPGPGRKSIAEHVVHAAYWKYAVRRLLRNDPRGSFALKGSNWFALGESISEPDWKTYVALLEAEHRLLHETISIFPAARLHEPSPKKKYRCVDVIRGVTAHDLYHAGQIQLIRRLVSEGD